MAEQQPPGPIANHKPLSTEQLIALVRATREKVAATAADLEMLTHELRLRLGMADDDTDDGGEA